MSRHRAVRNYDYDDYDDYYDDDDYYEEDYVDDGGDGWGTQRDAAPASSFGAFLDEPPPQAAAPAAGPPPGLGPGGPGAAAPAAPASDERTVMLRVQLLSSVGNKSWEDVGLSDADVDGIIQANGHDPALSLDAIFAASAAKAAGGSNGAQAAAATSAAAATPTKTSSSSSPGPVVPRPVRARRNSPVLDMRTGTVSTSRPQPGPAREPSTSPSKPRKSPPRSPTPSEGALLSPIPSSGSAGNLPRLASRGSLNRTPSPAPGSILDASLDDDPPSAPEPEDERAAEEAPLSMVVIGHVDAGKSTLMGRLLLHCGEISSRFVDKLKRDATAHGKSSFHLAWAMDEGDTEREHGVTMDVAQKIVRLPSGRQLTLLDAPGHADFVPRMIAGAAQADVALLVVPASTGEFEAAFGEGGQTREHALLARGMGVAQILVAVNKLDLAEPAWSRQRFDEIRAQVQPYLLSCGFKALKIRFVPVSGLTGANVGGPASRATEEGEASAGPLRAWYDGPTLIDCLDAFTIPPRQLDKPFRLIINDVVAFGRDKARASGVCVAGRVRQGSKLVVMPIGDVVHVRKMFRNRPKNADSGGATSPYGDTLTSAEEEVERGAAGDSLDVVISGVEDCSRIALGSVLCKARRAELVPCSRKVQVQMRTFDTLKVPMIKGSAYMLHRDGKELPCVVCKLLETVKNDGTVAKSKPRHILANTTCRVRIRFDQALCLDTYAECRALGRFALRYRGITVAAGIVMELLA
uniref:Tr-type G domain-containing protein n=1 Tax=Phaeomonas parva TaxID=124430 RepID=A0A6U4E4V9_9STRA|mmetsp:Transcript_19579/g.59275  ORF Transcript_19579/g.59275 Transcript_19579/m.59275 type:complete len:749 (+) Transcript_19579:407-2653(+)